jgi:lipopolysaccharide assembly outer membrane protein LptD (OstA)
MIKIIKIFFISIFVIGCNNAIKQIESTETTEEEMPDQICYNMEIAFIDSSATKTLIKAGRARVFHKSKQTILDSNVIVYFFNANGIREGVLNADTVNIDDVSKDMLAKGNVIVVSDSASTKLQTNELH